MTLQQEAPAEPVASVPSRPTRGPNRTWRLLQVTHRWFSLITGIVLLLIILSGAILVLAPEIDEWTQPSLYRSTPSERLLTPEQAVAALKRAEPDFVPGDVPTRSPTARGPSAGTSLRVSITLPSGSVKRTRERPGDRGREAGRPPSSRCR